MEQQRSDYLAYMLRLWRAGDLPVAGQTPNWRASLENPHTGERIGFGSLAELFTFLQEEIKHGEAGDDSQASTTKRRS